MPPCRMRIVECGMRIASGGERARPAFADFIRQGKGVSFENASSVQTSLRRIAAKRSPRRPLPNKRKCRMATRPSGILASAIKQKLNCALPFRSSLSLGFFRFRGLNGISEIPKDIGLSRRPMQSAFESFLRHSTFGIRHLRKHFSLERR